MIDRSVLKDILENYKADLHWRWRAIEEGGHNEKYKWEAVKWFQDHWDIDAPDFAEMLDASLNKTSNLLRSAYFYARDMIVGFAKNAPEEVRDMFCDLFDENLDLVDRIARFKLKSGDLLERYGDGKKQHFQTENAITTYLWLHYPDKYYVYRFAYAKDVAEALGSDYTFKQGAYADNIHNFMKLYDEINDALKENDDIVTLLKSLITEDCCNDPELKTLTIDFGFYISKFWFDWFPTNYAPGLGVDQWAELIEDKSVFDGHSLEVMKRMKDFGGQATCKQLSERYGESPAFYSSVSAALARRIVKKTGCPVLDHDNLNAKWWPVLYIGMAAMGSVPGTYVWKLRDELAEALELADLSQVRLYADDRAVNEDPIGEERFERYGKDDFLSDACMIDAEKRYDELVELIRDKKNVILQGAPGVGKTFLARRLAWSMMGKKDDSRIGFVQFHQNYNYEDFIMGYRPSANGFELRPGVFYEFCQKAKERPDEKFFFLIDEINRGNLSKIFGELLMLIENDYRGEKATLPYGGKELSVPQNLYIIGMMNMADRSLAMIDYALRRRFSFFEMSPGFDSDGFKKYKESLTGETKAFDNLIKIVMNLNDDIEHDKSLGKGFCIGHSYFCRKKEVTKRWLCSIVDYDILPTLSEYWFDNEEKLDKWKTRFENWKNDPEGYSNG